MKITKRECEVLTKISLGLTAKEIASMLFLSHHTIDSHKKNLMEKLEAANAPQLVRKGFQMGILKLSDSEIEH